MGAALPTEKDLLDIEDRERGFRSDLRDIHSLWKASMMPMLSLTLAAAAASSAVLLAAVIANFSQLTIETNEPLSMAPFDSAITSTTEPKRTEAIAATVHPATTFRL